MKWLIVVLFATMEGDLYVFTDPTFETQQECRAFITDREKIPMLVEKLNMEYGVPMPIQGVNCIQEELFKEIMSGTSKT